MTGHRLGEISVASTGPRLRNGALVQAEAFLARNRHRLAWVHLAMFLLFGSVVLVPAFLPVPGEDATPLNNFTRFANFLMWGIWFPFVFLSVLATGRSWCGLLCPMGAASELANRVGPKWRVPGWLRWRGTPVVSFLLVTIWGQTVGVRDYADGIAIVFGTTMAAAIIIGFLYGGGSRRLGKRPWCRHACPIGLLLGVFSRLGAVQFSPKRPRARDDAYTEEGVCPTLIDISRKAESRHCIECFRCVHPEARGGLYVHGRRPGTEVAHIRDFHPSPAEVWFLFLGSGTALGGFLWLVLPLYTRMRDALGTWLIERGIYWIGEPGPAWLMSVHPGQREVFTWLDFFAISGFMLGVAAALTALLAATTGASAWLAGRAGGDRTFPEQFTELGYPLFPVAMVSLLVGLGGKLFTGLVDAGVPAAVVGTVKGGLFAAGLAWSLVLAHRILARQGVAPGRRWLPMIPGGAGSLAVALAWWPAIFGP